MRRRGKADEAPLAAFLAALRALAPKGEAAWEPDEKAGRVILRKDPLLRVDHENGRYHLLSPTGEQVFTDAGAAAVRCAEVLSISGDRRPPSPHRASLRVYGMEGNDFSPRYELLGETRVTVGEPILPEKEDSERKKPNGNDLHDPDQ